MDHMSPVTYGLKVFISGIYKAEISPSPTLKWDRFISFAQTTNKIYPTNLESKYAGSINVAETKVWINNI